MAHVRFLLDRYIAANQGQENSLLGNDYELKAIADAFASCRAVDPIFQTFDLSLFETTILLSCVGQAIAHQKAIASQNSDRPSTKAIALSKKIFPIKKRSSTKKMIALSKKIFPTKSDRSFKLT